MKLLLILAFIYNFYYSSTGGDYSLKTVVEVSKTTIEISNDRGCIEYEILKVLPKEQSNTGEVQRFEVNHRGMFLYLEINKEYCFVKGKEEEVYSNFQVRKIEN